MNNMWNVTVELNEGEITEERASDIIDVLSGYHPAVGRGSRNRPSVTISLPADGLRQAIISGLAVIESQTGSEAAVLEAMTSAEFDIRNGLEPVPDLLSVTQVADELGQTRQAVLKAINSGRFTTSTRVGDSWAIARSEVERRKAVIEREREVVPFSYSGIELTEEQLRTVFDPMYDALRVIGTSDAYGAHVARANGKEHNAAFAAAWESALTDAIQAIGQLGLSTAHVEIWPSELPGRTVGAR